MTRVCALFLSLALAASMQACRPTDSSSPASEPAAVARAESDLGSLELSLSATELRTVDRLEVSIRLVRRSGAAAGELAFDPEAVGWTVAHQSPPQTRLLETGDLETRWTFTLEPFLDGDYLVPPAGVELISPGADAATLITPPQKVTVTSVLAGSEETELAPPRAIVEPAPAADQRPYGFAIAVAGAVVVIVAAVLVTRRMGRRTVEPIQDLETPDARAQARKIHQRLAGGIARCCRDGEQAQTTDDLAHLIARCREIQDRDAWVSILRDLDASIYGPTTPSPTDLANLDRRAGALLGNLEPDEPARGVG